MRDYVKYEVRACVRVGKKENYVDYRKYRGWPVLPPLIVCLTNRSICRNRGKSSLSILEFSPQTGRVDDTRWVWSLSFYKTFTKVFLVPGRCTIRRIEVCDVIFGKVSSIPNPPKPVRVSIDYCTQESTKPTFFVILFFQKLAKPVFGRSSTILTVDV